MRQRVQPVVTEDEPIPYFEVQPAPPTTCTYFEKEVYFQRL